MLIHDPAVRRLGRLPRRVDARTLKLAHFLDQEALPPIPSAINYGDKVKDWGMLLNDQLGDCTCAGILHLIQAWRASDGNAQPFTDADALSLYEKLCGYKDGDASTDNGGVELDILKAWRKEPIHGCTLSAFVSVDPRNWKQVKTAIFLFGPLYAGLDLPTSAQKEKVWKSTSGAPGTWGGHCTIVTGFRDRQNCMEFDTAFNGTWGTDDQAMTREWMAKYCTELYALLSPDWCGPDGKAPNGLNMDRLNAALAQV